MFPMWFDLFCVYIHSSFTASIIFDSLLEDLNGIAILTGNALQTQECSCFFSIIVVVAFKYFIHKFIEVYFDDWTIFGLIKDHIESLRLMLEHCRLYQISVILNKCIFCAPFCNSIGPCGLS